jgi:hypothetical protein
VNKVVKKAVWALALSLALVGAFNNTSPDISALLAKFLLGVQFLVFALLFQRDGLEQLPSAHGLLLTLVILTFIYILLIQTLLSFTAKFKWKTLSLMAILALCLTANMGASHFYQWELTKPQWQSYAYGDFHFSLECPYPLKSDALVGNRVERNNAETVEIRREMKAQTGVVHLFLVDVECKEYAAQPPTLDQLKSSWERILGPQKVKSVLCSGFPAIEIHGSARDETLELVHARFQYDFGVIYSPEDPKKGKEMMERVFSSIQIQD